MAYRHNMSQDLQVFADNCEACGEECLNTELEKIAIKGISWKLRLCKSCVAKDSLAEYTEAIKIIIEG